MKPKEKNKKAMFNVNDVVKNQSIICYPFNRGEFFAREILPKVQADQLELLEKFAFGMTNTDTLLDGYIVFIDDNTNNCIWISWTKKLSVLDKIKQDKTGQLVLLAIVPATQRIYDGIRNKLSAYLSKGAYRAEYRDTRQAEGRCRKYRRSGVIIGLATNMTRCAPNINYYGAIKSYENYRNATRRRKREARKKDQYQP